MKKHHLLLAFFCLLLALPVVATAAPESKPRPAQAAVATINLNTASVKELEALPGIGRATADNIVAYRTEKGKFRSVDELVKVKGVGDKTLDKVRNLVSVE